jgi:hypothetical protein
MAAAGLRDVTQIRQGLDVFHVECEEVSDPWVVVLLLLRTIQRWSPISTKGGSCLLLLRQRQQRPPGLLTDRGACM